jgi:hypothetical protein
MPGTDLCVEYKLDLGTDLYLNQGGLTGTTTTIRPTQITGLDGRPIRATILPNGNSSGGDKLTAQFGPRLINVQGEIIAYTAGEMLTPVDNVTTYLTAVNALVAAWISGLEGVLNSTFALTWTPTGGSGQSLTVSYGYEGAEFQSVPSPDLSGPTTVSFGLVAETG